MYIYIHIVVIYVYNVDTYHHISYIYISYIPEFSHISSLQPDTNGVRQDLKRLLTEEIAPDFEVVVQDEVRTTGTPWDDWGARKRRIGQLKMETKNSKNDDLRGYFMG